MKWILIWIVFFIMSCTALDINRHHQERWTRSEKESFLKLTNWSPSVQSAIIEGAVQMGMTDEQVRMSVGRPRSMNQSVGGWGVHEQWVYDWAYIYFDNGIVTSWQRKR